MRLHSWHRRQEGQGCSKLPWSEPNFWDMCITGICDVKRGLHGKNGASGKHAVHACACSTVHTEWLVNTWVSRGACMDLNAGCGLQASGNGTGTRTGGWHAAACPHAGHARSDRIVMTRVHATLGCSPIVLKVSAAAVVQTYTTCKPRCGAVCCVLFSIVVV